jgi:hypothetical protein
MQSVIDLRAGSDDSANALRARREWEDPPDLEMPRTNMKSDGLIGSASEALPPLLTKPMSLR